MTDTSPPTRGRFRAILGYASLALVIFLLITGFRGYRNLTLAKEREARLTEEIERTELEIQHLARKVERLRTDPVLLERLAREELGMVKPEDVVVLVEPESPPARSTATAPDRPPAEPSSDPREPTSP